MTALAVFPQPAHAEESYLKKARRGEAPAGPAEKSGAPVSARTYYVPGGRSIRRAASGVGWLAVAELEFPFPAGYVDPGNGPLG